MNAKIKQANRQLNKDYIGRCAKQRYHEDTKEKTATLAWDRITGSEADTALPLMLRVIPKSAFCNSVGKLHEIQNFSYPLGNTWGGLLPMVPDLVFAGYPTNVIVGAMKRMASKTGHAGWVTNIQQAKLAYRMVQTQSNRPSTQSNSE